MGHKRLLRDAALYPGVYEIISDYRAKMIKEFKLGFVEAPSDKKDYEWYLAARGISRSAYEMQGLKLTRSPQRGLVTTLPNLPSFQ
jgi:hypothetical protein